MKRIAALALALGVAACAAPKPDYPIHLTPADRALLRAWAPAFVPLCMAEQLRECR